VNVVIYTADFEPITIIDLPIKYIDMLHDRGHIRLAIMDPPKSMATSDPVSEAMVEFKTVALRSERMRWIDGSMKSILVTDDDELALLLRPSWLPGQQRMINEHKRMQLFTMALINQLASGRG